jgi:hypothetical protein
MSQNVPQIYRDKLKTTLLVRIEKYAIISLAVSMLLSVFWIGFVIRNLNERKHEGFVNISKIVKYDENSYTYLIGREDF